MAALTAENVKPLSRWQASGLHFAICIAIGVVTVSAMLLVWYPRPLFEAAGGNDLLFILVGVDVVLGPLLTLVVFKAGKRGMRFDLWVIATLQLAALIYGVHIMFLARPAYVVFVKDRFEVITAVELQPEELAKAKQPQYRSVPLGGPQLVAADMPTDPAERNKILDAALAGLDLHHFPRLYVPYDARRKEVLAAAQTIDKLRQTEPGSAPAVDAWLADTGRAPDSVRALMLRTRFAWVVVLVDPRTAEPVKMLLGEKIT
jgi:hypothetical protein